MSSELASQTVPSESPVATTLHGTAVKWRHPASQDSFIESEALAIEGLSDATEPAQTFATNGKGSTDRFSERVAADPAAARVVRLPVVATPEVRYQLLQQWEGTVTSIGNGEFRAELRDLTKSALPEEIATFSIEEVSDADQPFVAPGAIFYWSICYEITKTKQKKTVSLIRFQRLPAWTRSEIEAIRRKAQQLDQVFGDVSSTTDADAH